MTMKVDCAVWFILACLCGKTAYADEPKGFLETLHKHRFLTSTIADNGDLNPYAVVVAPVSAGDIETGDVLVDNFNNMMNLQGTGTSIIRYRPSTKTTVVFAELPQKLKDCPGGVGLTTAMTMLQSGWIIVGSAPSSDGTTKTKGDGCLLVLNPKGQLVATWASPLINAPWGNMAVIDKGGQATLFISMAGAGLKGPDVIDPHTKYPIVEHNATVVRFELIIDQQSIPIIKSQTVIADGFSHRADFANFLLGPTGLAIGSDDTLYVTDGLDNEVTAIADASTRSHSDGKGRLLTKDGLLSWPLAMARTAQDHLLITNGRNGQIVEVDTRDGKQLYAHWLNANQAQSPPGNGNLFGFTMTEDGKSIYYVEDDINALRVATP
jgi:hypothetical protein